MAAVTIRQERPDHPEVIALLDELDRYLATLYPPEANHILGLQALLAPEVDFRVAAVDGRIVGCGAVRRMPAEPATGGRAYGEVKRMVTAPAARGQGIGGQLLSALEQGLRAGSITLALLETGAEQASAVRLYERFGYRRRGPFGGYPDNGMSVFFEKAIV